MDPGLFDELLGANGQFKDAQLICFPFHTTPFTCLTQLNLQFTLITNIKMPANVSILIVISRINLCPAKIQVVGIK